MPHFAYIDPGTGSMLFTILISVVGAAFYALRTFIIKLRFSLSGGRDKKLSMEKIPYVIFSDSKRYWNIFGPICREFDRRGQKLVYMTASEDDPALTEQFKHVECKFIGEGNKAFTKLNFLNAGVLLSTTPGIDVYQWKRSKDVQWYAHVLHAANDATSYRMFGIDYYDSILVSGEYQKEQVRKLEELRNLPEKEVEVVGLTYFDEMKKRLEAEGKKENGDEKVVLLAPSWGGNSILNKYGERMIDALLATGYHVIIRPHPQSYTSEKDMLDALMAKYPESAQLEWNHDNDNFDVLNRSDILISDFSGVMFDFSLVFDKPIIYADTSFDKGIYDACWLDEEMWTFDILPEIGAQLTEDKIDDIKAVIDTCLTDPKFAAGRDKARSDAWAHPGEATKRTVDYLMAKYEELNPKEEEVRA